ncbi:MAG: S41 family peptidase [Candidatus Aminicenantaceae bacterium]
MKWNFGKRALNVLLMGVLLLLSCRTKGSREDTQTIQNLRAFAKLYGYVRYFHPSDEASQVDWERFAIYGAEKVKTAKDSEELKSILEQLFLPIAPMARIYLSDDKRDATQSWLPEETDNLKVVAWQHKGLGFGSSNSVYMSIRLNRENVLSGGTGAGILTQGIEARSFRGKKIKLKSSARTVVKGVGNQAQLWMRVDKEGGIMGFFDNMSDRPILSEEWKEYEIEGHVDDDAVMVFFGAILGGNGQAWFDEFQVLVMDENGHWQPAEINNPGFEEGEMDKKPRSWGAQSAGYMYKVQGENARSGEKCMLLESQSTTYSGKLFDKFPDVGEVINKELDAGLSCSIPLALYSEEKKTLRKNENYPLDDLTSKMEAHDFAIPSADNVFVRLADVVIAWNILQHFYPYFDVVDVDWDLELTNTLREALNNTNEEDFFYTLSRLVAKLQDGHGNVYHKVFMEQAGLPLKVDWVEDQVVVTASEDSDHFQRGDIILNIDGKQAEQTLLDAEKFISGSPQWKRYKSLIRFGYGKKGTLAKLEVLRGTETFEVELMRSFKKMLAEPTRPRIESLENNIYYVNLDQAPWNEITEKINDLAGARGVIFDLRGYPKGNHEIICHLLAEKDTSNAWMQIPQIIYPDQENIVGYQKMGWNLVAKKPHITGKVAFITDGRAISYAESFLSFIEHYKLGEIVGQPTAGTNGNINPFVLPGDFQIVWTGMKVLKHDGSQHHLIGIQPTVPAKRTIRGIIEGRDEFFEKALEIIR